MALLLGGGRALLMQLAHPKIAAGVSRYSSFRADPLGRLARTMHTMWSIVFDDAHEAGGSLERFFGMHRKVWGAIGEGESLPQGTGFHALDPELLFWVHATLVDSALLTYDLLVEPLKRSERAQYYEDTKRLAAVLGIPDADIPRSLRTFDDYMSEMLAGGAIAVGPTARAVARKVLYPTMPVLKLAGPLIRLVTAGMLSDGLRAAYGIPWSPPKETAFRATTRSIRAILPLLPEGLRIAPNARAAERRWNSCPNTE